MNRRTTVFRMVVVLTVFVLPLPISGEWRADPLSIKLKWAEEETQVLLGGGWGYYAPAFRWTNDLRWRNNASPTQPVYYKTKWQRRIGGDWWWSLAGRYAVAPTCDFRWAEAALEKSLARPWAFRVWGAGEWRRVNSSGTLEDYDWQLIGFRLRWRPFTPIAWTGELTREEKNYPSPGKSSVKTALSNEVTFRFAPHTLYGRWAESVRVYPEDAWKNYYHRSLRLEWNWDISNNAYFEGNCGYNQQSQGSGKTSGELQITGILDYPSTREYKLSWLWSAAKTVAAEIPLTEEEEEELPAAGWRFGLRWQDLTPPYTLRVELFGQWQEGELTGGWAARLQGHHGRFRWTLGLAPRGGFYPSAEKGYWVEVKYYLD
ncbi:MAG TPA: hypothetical protein GXX33_07760 [Firmicutes bacterium]|uniref:Uncharacterized protein n=1 Tax=Capillibacterium thermochitinicola TaxID=2699427 RepID=A0A8J6I2L5_9FIRM|nr:hypothetical protein [Capillibacterium thermochitinicola]MBA2134068.1 hypothetical protein [Capillibacterium thermochitinicola]HHW12879.1 hypothetical protein [Bacillota bacterium]